MICSLETRFATLCEQAGIVFRRDDAQSGLDFYLPELDTYVEIKRYHSERISGQMARRDNVIAIQGIGALEAFAKMLGVAV